MRLRRKLPALAAIAALALPVAPALADDGEADNAVEVEDGEDQDDDDQGKDEDDDEVAATPAPRVVVGTTDTGVNPYHQHFKVAQSAVTPDVLAEFGIDDAHVLHVGISYEEDLARGLYDTVVPGEDYWFAGTNLIVRADSTGVPLVADDHVHGVGVTGAIVAANPDAVVFFVEGFKPAEVFAHPAVDIVSTSFGTVMPVDTPLGGPLNPFPGGREAVVEGGKLLLTATPNVPTPAPADAAGGVWWAMNVSGWDEGPDEAHGKQFFSTVTPDLVADFIQRLPYCFPCTDEYRQKTGGTSFATPRTAGIASRILLEARRRSGHVGGITVDGLLVDAGGATVSNWDLRRALEEGAATVTSPTPDQRSLELMTQDGTIPILVAEEAFTGWGLVTDDPSYGVVDETLAHLGFGTPTRTKPLATCHFMLASFDARVAAYAANPTSPSFGDTSTPGYQRCA